VCDGGFPAAGIKSGLGEKGDVVVHGGGKRYWYSRGEDGFGELSLKIRKVMSPCVAIGNEVYLG
jgi:hypothetical protein